MLRLVSEREYNCRGMAGGYVILTLKHLWVFWNPINQGTSELGRIAIEVIVGHIVSAADPVNDKSSSTHFVPRKRDQVRKGSGGGG